MSRSRGANNSVSLFPFLAVLVCAMGALIFLLLVTTRRIRSTAIARAQQEREEQAGREEAKLPVLSIPAPAPIPKPEPIDPDEPLRARLAVLRSQRDAAADDLNRRLANLRAAKDAVARAEADLNASAESLDRLAAAQANLDRDLDLIRRQRENLKNRTSDLRRASEEMQRYKNAAQSKFSFVPFDGLSGTTKRPILIECTAHGLRFIPEDVTLGEAELKGFPWSRNPLLEATRALIAYWTAVDRVKDPDAESPPEPYPLLIVRPDGAAAFYAARKLLGELNQSYGYELADEDLELELPQADPEAQAVVREAIRQMLDSRNHFRQALANGKGSHFGSIGFRRGTGEPYSPDLERSPFPGGGNSNRPPQRSTAPPKVMQIGEGSRTGPRSDDAGSRGQFDGKNASTTGGPTMQSGTRTSGGHRVISPGGGTGSSFEQGTRRRSGNSLIIDLPPKEGDPNGTGNRGTGEGALKSQGTSPRGPELFGPDDGSGNPGADDSLAG